MVDGTQKFDIIKRVITDNVGSFPYLYATITEASILSARTVRIVIGTTFDADKVIVDKKDADEAVKNVQEMDDKKYIVALAIQKQLSESGYSVSEYVQLTNDNDVELWTSLDFKEKVIEEVQPKQEESKIPVMLFGSNEPVVMNPI